MWTREYADKTKYALFTLSLVSTVQNVVSKLEAEVRSAARHQTHAVPAAGCGEMTHCGPLVLFRVVLEHVVSIGGASPTTCSAIRVNIIIDNFTKYCPELTCYHEPSMVQSHALDSMSSRGQAGHQLPGAAQVLVQGLGGCQVGGAPPA